MAQRQPLIPASAVPWLATGGALAALCIAWIAQYGFGLAPCELCYLQRYGYWVAIALGVVAILQPAHTPRRTVAVTLLGLAFLATAGIALFHVGVEQKWWQGFASCTGSITPGMTPEELQKAIQDAPIVRCDEPAWTMFGISMAGYNLAYALLLTIFTLGGALGSKAA
ncbi:MAG TPA: disulfide bond formation protein B [Dongiaceae bacterium]|jgi:disulfide bond formation protein DsbB